MRTRYVVFLLLVALASPPAARAAPSRRDAVLHALQEAVHARPGAHFNARDVLSTVIAPRRVPEAGRRLFVPVLPAHCGTGMAYGGLDPAQARALARRLFAAYGYDLQPGSAATIGGQRLAIDGLDAEARLGYVLQDDATPGVPERIAGERVRLLVVPRALYRSMQADTLTPLLAFGLSVLDFLNEQSPDEDVDVTALAEGRAFTADLPSLSAKDVPRSSSFQMTNGNAFFVADGRGTTMLSFEAFSEKPASGPGLLVLPSYWTPPPGADGAYDLSTPPPRFYLLQGELRFESESGVFVLPEAFDARRPFRVRVDYVPGQVYLGSPVTLRLP